MVARPIGRQTGEGFAMTAPVVRGARVRGACQLDPTYDIEDMPAALLRRLGWSFGGYRRASWRRYERAAVQGGARAGEQTGMRLSDQDDPK